MHRAVELHAAANEEAVRHKGQRLLAVPTEEEVRAYSETHEPYGFLRAQVEATALLHRNGV